MSLISYCDLKKASEETKTAYEAELQRSGYVTNMKKTLLHSLPAYHALMQWYPLRDAVQSFLEARSVVVFCHAISTENECLICSMFFRRAFADLGVDLKTLTLSSDELLLERYGRALVANPQQIEETLFQSLKERFSEEEIVALTAFGALMIATNLINNALKVDLDAHLEPFYQANPQLKS